ncbi:MAG: DUF692 family protein [Alphaproteobacteria bacterium]|nr:DUF692 family protein [Alphaproteobacteria bacterium]
MTLRVGLSLMPQADFAAAALPLLQQGLVDVLEWGPDLREGPDWVPPDWFRALVAHFAGEGALLGHGVSGGLLSFDGDAAFDAWLAEIRVAVTATPVASFSEHYGFVRTRGWERTPPLPVRPDRETVVLGVARLERLREAVGAPVGLEDLALALSDRDLDARGAVLEVLLEPVDGFLHLDLHNLWCAAVNFDRDPVALMERYPLHRVRRIHLSGGSWSSVPGMDRPFRRDTHDDGVPDEVIALLPEALARCPGTTDVILEQLGGTIDPERYGEDFVRIRAAAGPVEAVDVERPGPFVPVEGAMPAEAWQDGLVTALSTGAPWGDWPDDLDARATSIARMLVGRWGRVRT